MRIVSCGLCGSSASLPERKLKGYDLVRCIGCGLVYMNPQLTDEETQTLYADRDETGLADLYTRIASAPSVKSQYSERLAWLEGIVGCPGRLLDFGCAAGHFVEVAQGRGWDAHGCELGRWAGDAARARGLANIRIGSLAEVGYPTNYFEVVHAAQVFEHVPRPKDELAQIFRVLKPGWYVYIDVPNYGMLTIRLGVDDFMLNDPPQHVNYFTHKTLTRLVSDCGYSPVVVATFGGMKWENLLGRAINSEIREAYEAIPGDVATSRPPSPLGSSGLRAMKDAMKRYIVGPFLYKRMKLAMGLLCLAQKR